MTQKSFRYRLNKSVKTVSIIGTTVFISFTLINSATAATQDSTQTRTVSQTATSVVKNSNVLSSNQGSNPIGEFINDVDSFIRGDLFGGIAQLVESTIGSVEVPDLGQVVSQIMNGSLPEDAATSTKLENNLDNSYAIRQDLANQSERIAAVQVAQAKTLAVAAQDKSKATLEQSANSAIESTQMAQDSQNSDTSQQILQNISQQLSNQTAIANLQIEEASQARQDRALGLTLSAQAAQELNAANTRERQSAIATGNTAVASGALLTMPGSAVLGQDLSTQ